VNTTGLHTTSLAALRFHTVALCAERVVARTGVDGVMAARGILANPAMYHPNRYAQTPTAAVEQYTAHAMAFGPPTSFSVMHHHLQYMLEKRLCAQDRREFNELHSAPGVLDFLRARGLAMRPSQPP